MALILRKIFSGVLGKVTGAKLILVNSMIASLAGGTASFLNTYFMRRVEMNNGIEIFEDEKLTQRLGNAGLVSKECATKAIFETAWSRVFLSISCLMTPAVIFFIIEKLGRTPTRPMFKLPYEVSVFIFALMVGLPASISMFPQTGSLHRSQIEQDIADQIPERVTTVFYNKGL